MITIKSNRGGDDSGEAHNFWVSYSDLMASMLLVFVLLLVVSLFHFAESNERKEKVLEQQQVKMRSFATLQKSLVSKLSTAFEDEAVSIDPKTGVLQIGSAILFGEGEFNLRPEGRVRLLSLFDAYMRVVLDAEFSQFIKQIEIEGHSNTNGTYLYNLELSQKRALAVMKELLDHSVEDRARLEELVVASGRSYARLILDYKGEEDPIRSRRIEIKFRLKEAELFQDIYQELEK